MSESSELVIVYDGDCPFCSRYVELVKIQETVGSVRLVNARSGGADVMALQRAGYDLNEGMIAKYEGRIYHGADCVNLLALLSSESGRFNQINRAIFGSASLSRLLYPALRRGRALTLRILGRSRIKLIGGTNPG
jgi:predicted DCC family thiol-disulfide oxidoreductase YuxK